MSKRGDFLSVPVRSEGFTFTFMPNVRAYGLRLARFPNDFPNGGVGV